MAIGSCCKIGINNEKPNRYLGRTALQEHDYFKSGLFPSRNPITMDFALTPKLKITRANTPNYIYDVSVSNEILAYACGDAGVFFWNIKNLNNITFIRNKCKAENFNSETISGKNSALGEFFIGNGNGSRYGFEKEPFSGNYSVCNHKNIFFAANLDSGSSSSIKAFDPIRNNEYKFNVTIDGIITAMAVDGENLYVGTSGYQPPKLSYGSNLADWTKYQPEYSDGINGSDKYWEQIHGSGKIFIFDIETLNKKLTEIEDLNREYQSSLNEGKSGGPSIDGFTDKKINIRIKQVFRETFSHHVNDIKTSGDNICIATGVRVSSGGATDKTKGELYHYEREIKTNEDFTTGEITSKKFEFKGGDRGYETDPNGSVTATAIDGNDIYCVDSSYGIIKNGEKWFDATAFTSSNICRDQNVSCFDFSSFPFVVYNGYYGVRPNLFQDPTGTRVERFLCPDDPSVTKDQSVEMIDSFPNSIIVTSTSVFLGLWQNGYISVNKTTGLAEYHHFGLYIRDLTCETFISSFDNINKYDVHESYNFSVGKMATNGNAVFIVDSIQYIANGAGPGIYSPIKREIEDVIQFSGLIKNYKNFSGIAICSPREGDSAPTSYT